ncbi:mechanosensitive channel MscK [Denitrificimonas caeni]|uniref:Mechanosensitive channel MscK n=1 Tax=Denitrificimonas caeni TaxID=521720 RepID=A0AAE9VQ96_9GAMM|nr:mechanosensitive channel MscK [Denitrificimonas caeni]WBE25547.1 mechanosensitive channel MscK [Denitrificimonas caeni]
MKFRVLLLLIACLVGFPVSANSIALNPQDVRQALTDLPTRKLPEAEQQAVQQALEQTLAWLDIVERTEQAQKKLQEQLAAAPQQISAAQNDLQRLLASTQADPSQHLAKASVKELEDLLAEHNLKLRELQKDLNDANALIVTAQTRPERAQAEISSNQTRIQKINNLLKTVKDDSKLSSSEKNYALKAELLALESKSNLRRAELSGNSVLQELGSSRRDLLLSQVNRQEQDILALQSLLNQKRQADSEKTVAELSLEVSKAGTDSLLLRESNLNLKLSDYLLTITERRNQLTQRNLLVRQQLDSVQQTDQALEEQISVLQGSLLLAKILYEQKQALPQLSFDRSLADQIADTRLYQFELRQLRDTVSRSDEYVERVLRDTPSSDEQIALRSSLLDLVRSRADLLDRLNRELNAYLSESITLQLNQKQLQSMTAALRTTLDEQMFWIPSNKPLDWDWIKAAPDRLKYQFTSVLWGNETSLVWQSLVKRIWWFTPLFVFMFVMLWKRPKIIQALRDLHADIGHFRKDSQMHTPRALFLNLLLAAPGALALASFGLALSVGGQGSVLEIGDALLAMAQVWLVFYCMYRILAPNGMAIMHFRWPRAQVAFLQPKIRALGLTALLLSAVVTVAQGQPAALSEDVVGIILLMGCLLSLTWLMARLVFHRYSFESTSLLRRLIGLVVVLLPFLFTVALVSGYYYTALKLSERLINTLSLVLIWILLEAMVVRGLALAARRLAWQRAQDARQNQPKDGVEGEVATDDMVLDISQINDQSLRLARLVLLGVFVVSLYWVWSDLLSLFTYLDNVTLYENISSVGAIVPISLRDVLDAGAIIVIAIMLARNLPGLLEVLFLSRLKLAQGTAYATTTLLSYTISATGFVATLSVLGVSWDKLQWLVAALSVGLGFGLQEIFANFVSGLIILFERPVRIGDVVTIGNLSGTVSRIRIRATTITDFDRKEIIVPNKVFVTDQLVNWSLSDTVTRVVIKIGIAYDADMDLARKLMIQAMQENPRVMRDPEPLVLFLQVTPSIFEHELRYHVSELSDRNPSIDEVLQRIVLSFREHHIDMAFNQLDVTLKNRQGDERQLLQTTRNPLTTNQAPSV